jgi:hypothetical protein
MGMTNEERAEYVALAPSLEVVFGSQHECMVVRKVQTPDACIVGAAERQA